MTADYVIETPRLRLRQMIESDLDFITMLLSDPTVMRYYPGVESRDGSRAWMERQWARYERDGHGLWLIEDRETGAPLGQAGLVNQTLDGWPEPRYPEIGYMLHHRYWHRGFASEAARATRRYAFTNKGYDRVISLIRPENLPSRAVASRLGMAVLGSAIFHGLEHLVYGQSLDESIIRITD